MQSGKRADNCLKMANSKQEQRGGDACFCLVTHQLADICAVSFALTRGWLWSRAGLIKELFDRIFSTLRNEKTFKEHWMFSRDVQKNVWVTEWGKWGTNSRHLPFIYITVYMKETMRSVKKAKKILKSLLQRVLTAFLFSKLRWTCSKLKYNDAPILTYGWPLHFVWKNDFINPTRGIHSIIKMNTAAQERVVW